MNDPARPFKNASANLPRNRSRREKVVRLFADWFVTSDNTGVLLMDNEFRIVEMSDIVSRLVGVVKTEWTDRTIEEWFEEVGWIPYPFDRSILEGVSFRNRSLTWGEAERRKNLMLDGHVLSDWKNGETVGAFVLFRDVSHLVRLEDEIRRSDRLKTIGQIAAGAAHEIRNPLTAIRGFMQLLTKSLTEKEMARETEFVRIMLSELDRVNELVNEFLLLSKPKEVRFAALKAGRVMQEMLPMIRSEALLHGVIVQFESQPEPLLVWVDKEQLKQVFLNLAKNAIEAMSGGGTLIIREEMHPGRPDELAVSIRDTGPGIEPNVLDRIFDPFFTTKPQGTGLGLSICQRIVHDLGGRLEVVSDGGGSCFTIWLPLAPVRMFDGAAGGAPARDDV